MTGPVPIDRVGILVPVRNEAELLPRCLAALTVAIEAVHKDPAWSRPLMTVVIVLDRCTDASAAVAARWPAFDTIHSDAGGVGAARRAGAGHLLRGRNATAARTWIATTDADSAVPPAWLCTHLAFARNGAELVLGTVRPDDALPGHEHGRWAARHELFEGHPHVHGANLGVRADRYLEAGGFARVEVDEDVRLVAALRGLGVTEARTARVPVLTSGRLTGRAPAGFADYLRRQTAT